MEFIEFKIYVEKTVQNLDTKFTVQDNPLRMPYSKHTIFFHKLTIMKLLKKAGKFPNLRYEH